MQEIIIFIYIIYNIYKYIHISEIVIIKKTTVTTVTL